MKKFGYEITKHPARDFSQVVYFCTEDGQCNYDQLPPDQIKGMERVLNERGAEGWELVQISFGADGFIAFWKRSI